jgi:Beta-glucosidase-related glycosidases
MERSKISKIDLKTKCQFLSGKDNWCTKELKDVHLKPIMMTDGPNGVRKCLTDSMVIESATVEATCFPCNVLLASTWNKKIAYEYGKALGEEAKENDVSILLGPGVNIKRTPLCGRNFEYLSEDPYVAGYIASEYIKGLQSNGVACSLKHFAGNNQETYRNQISDVVDERTLREIYLKPFEICVKDAKPKTIMTSYNKINGVYSSDNKWLLDDVCRKEWGYDGVFISDWRGLGHITLATEAGLNLEMPYSGERSSILLYNAVKENKISEKIVDDRVFELANFIENLSNNEKEVVKVDYEKHHKLAKEIASDGIVLLRNEEKILPLKEEDKVLICGDFLTFDKFEGGGSSHVNAKNITPLKKAFEGHKNVTFARGYNINNDKSLDRTLLDEALTKAKEANKVIIFIGYKENVESEGYDRDDMKLPKSQLKFINEILKQNKNVVVVLITGSPVELPFRNDIKGLLETYFAGEAYSEALNDILFGLVSPSGRLAETFPIKYKDIPCYKFYPGGSATCEYRESIFVGYRYYETFFKPVAYPFGFGLSYASFAYRNLSLRLNKDSLSISFKVKNTSNIKAKEVVEIYVGAPTCGVFKPHKELKDFDKIELESNEERVLHYDIPFSNLKYFNAKTHKWVLNPGEYRVYVGGDSFVEVLSAGIVIKSDDKTTSPYNKKELAEYYNGHLKDIDQEEFSLLMGSKLPKKNLKLFGPINEDYSIETIKHSFVGLILYLVVKNNKYLKKQEPMYYRSALSMPFRQILMMAMDNISEEERVVFYKVLNGHLTPKNLKVIKTLIKKIQL